MAATNDIAVGSSVPLSGTRTPCYAPLTATCSQPRDHKPPSAPW